MLNPNTDSCIEGQERDIEALHHVVDGGGHDQHWASNRILTWLTANPPGVWPQNTPTQWV